MKAVINLSTKKFKLGQERLKQSIIGKTDADIFWYRSELQVGAPIHSQEPYAFKPYALDKARKSGYHQVLWLDASMYVTQNLAPIFEYIEREGYFFQHSGWENARWTTPAQADYFGTMDGDMISAGVIGLDFRHKEANEFLDKWIWASIKGMFRGSHEETRHDQTCASLIIQQNKLKITPDETFWKYGDPANGYEPHILILAHGIC